MGKVFSDTLGGFETPGVGPNRKDGAWLIFIAQHLITGIVMLNTLIAVLGDSYNTVKK